MARKIFPGNYVNNQDSYDPVALAIPPFLRYRICGYFEIKNGNTDTTFSLIIPSVNNTDPNKTFPSGWTIPVGSYVMRYAYRLPSTNTDGEAVTVGGTNSHELILGPDLDDTKGGTIVAASSTFAAGTAKLDVFSPTKTTGALAIKLRVADGSGAAGAAPSVSKGTVRIPAEIVYAVSDDVITLEEIPNGYK
ncbi:hypothetical protein [Nodosilinea nodulosa]|uniref:hypothetical protein n=1 Tax=Nodosilinea nodulosa TaxID=416001 RepID=UPI000371AF20|nr:hypothetical protein [Nodosilinea nodulosa]